MAHIYRSLPLDIQDKINKFLIPFYIDVWKKNMDNDNKERIRFNYDEGASHINWCGVIIINKYPHKQILRLLDYKDGYYSFISSDYSCRTRVRESFLMKEDEFIVKWVSEGTNSYGGCFNWNQLEYDYVLPGLNNDEDTSDDY